MRISSSARGVNHDRIPTTTAPRRTSANPNGLGRGILLGKAPDDDPALPGGLNLKLHHITAENCPTCGACPVTESIRGQHCNGQSFESRGYSCGSLVNWLPNFSHLVIERQCPEDPSEQVRQARRQQARDKVRAFLGTLELDDDFARHITQALERTW